MPTPTSIQVKRNEEDRSILCTQIEKQKTKLAKFDQKAIFMAQQQISALQAKLTATQRMNKACKVGREGLERIMPESVDLQSISSLHT